MMVQPVGQVMHLIGTGMIEDEVMDTDSSHVQIKLLSISSVASSLASVGQIVRWPKASLAIAQSPPSESATTQENECTREHSTANSTKSSDEDGAMNYALQVVQLGVFLMQLNDTEKEGDGERCIINWKLLMMYFRSRKRGMKYAFEAMRLITCTKALLTEQLAHRVIHGQFVNTKGGVGKNIANDLKMETMVKDHKGVLRELCGNKTLKAIQRATSASHGLKSIIDVIDQESNVTPDSSHHTYASTTQLAKNMIEVLQKVKPFENQPGRKLLSFPNIEKSPLCKLNVTALHKWLTHNKKRLANDAFAMSDDIIEDDDGDSEDNDNLSDAESTDDEGA